MKCQVCHSSKAIWAWQPFGPGDDILYFSALGWHYRGFPVIKVCDHCYDAIGGSPTEFTYQNERYITSGVSVRRVPSYVSDALAWLEDTDIDGEQADVVDRNEDIPGIWDAGL